MGASASVVGASPRAWADPGLKELIEEVESLSNDINVHHRTLLKEQMKCTFKKHDKIIAWVTGKTKRQLDHMTTGDKSFGKKEIYELVGGKEYGKMLSRLCTPEMFLIKHDLTVACDGLGCDTDGVAFILCTSSPEDILRITSYCAEHGVDIGDMITKKTKANSYPQLFFQRILLPGARTNDDADNADANAIELREMDVADVASASKFFDILTAASYDQLERIDKSLQDGHGHIPITLEALLHQKFPKLPVDTYCQLWVRRPPAALAFLIEKIAKNPTRMCQLFSRLEKPAFMEIDSALRATSHSAGLAQFVKKNVSGNLARAMSSWMLTKYHDGGAEREAEAYIQHNKAAGYDLAALLQWDEGCAKLRELFEKAKSELGATCREQKVVKAGEPVPPEDLSEYVSGPLSVSSKRRYNEVDESYLDEDGGNEPGTGTGAGAGAGEDGESLDAKMALVKDYVWNHFKGADPDNSGYLPEEAFWTRFRELPLSEMGLSEHELDSIHEWCDWSDGEGVAYVDCLDEMADTLIAAIDSPDRGLTGKSVREIVEAHASSAPAPAPEENPSPSLLQYVHESFNAHSHTDSKDALTKDEFYAVVEMLNLGLCEGDIADLVERSDHNADSVIEWKEAVTSLTDLLHDMCSDERDHFIGLMDPESKLGFWYNVRDKSSQWMSEEENTWFAESGEIHRL